MGSSRIVVRAAHAARRRGARRRGGARRCAGRGALRHLARPGHAGDARARRRRRRAITSIDLGSGDGRIVITAAQRFGASGLGVEIVPELVSRAARTRAPPASPIASSSASRTCSRPTCGSATVVTMYLLPEVNLQLRPRLLALAPGTRIVSHDWDMGDWTPDRTSRSMCRTSRSASTSPRGSTCGSCRRGCTGCGARPARSLEITQRFQRFSATLSGRGRPAPALVFDGRIEATTLRGDGLHPVSLAARRRHAAAARRRPAGRRRAARVRPRRPAPSVRERRRRLPSYAVSPRCRWLYPALEVVHIVGIALLLGSLVLVELRLLGLGSALPMTALARFGLRLSWRASYRCGERYVHVPESGWATC